jgi:hypothetical protein
LLVIVAITRRSQAAHMRRHTNATPLACAAPRDVRQARRGCRDGSARRSQAG